MARVRVMYWKEIPVQVQAEDGDGQVSLPLDARFQEAADAIAMLDGSAGSDEYLDAWEWGAFEEAPGTAAEAAEARASLYNERIPGDFVARIRDMHRDGSRDPRPGAIDAWADEQQ
ncbi:MAG: virulence factor [Dehalococcoidia bacterium]